MNKKLYVGNLLYEINDDQLKTLFSQFGDVTSSQVIRYRDSGRSKGFGFVEMATEEAAQAAITALHGQTHEGRKLVVSEARPMREKTENGGNEDHMSSQPVVEQPAEENRDSDSHLIDDLKLEE